MRSFRRPFEWTNPPTLFSRMPSSFSMFNDIINLSKKRKRIFQSSDLIINKRKKMRLEEDNYHVEDVEIQDNIREKRRKHQRNSGGVRNIPVLFCSSDADIPVLFLADHVFEPSHHQQGDKPKQKNIHQREVIDLTEQHPTRLNKRFRELPEKLVCRVSHLWNCESSHSLIDSTQLTVADFQTLKENEWLNDQVINSYLEISTRKNKKKQEIVALNSFFLPLLTKKGNLAMKSEKFVKKLSLQLKQFKSTKVLIPAHFEIGHWALFAVDVQHCVIHYYDSLRWDCQEICQQIAGFFSQISTFSETDWRLQLHNSAPSQLNGVDCGVFVCGYIDQICRKGLEDDESGWDFAREDIPHLRKHFACQLLTGNLFL
eukprot:Lithocolla_globosa_v1_NODE_862_length_3171_cov_19.417843.p2 type:complete len:372 gc:universal NODE_862_length_3171_cov_19.417843:1925-3040(+)